MRANPSSWFLGLCALLLLMASIAECVRRYQRSYGLYPANEAWKGYFQEPEPVRNPTPTKETSRVNDERPNL